jgi:hypothetical protein
MFETPEEKAALEAAIESATAGLVAKNKELITELRTARKDHAIDPAVVAALEAKLDSQAAELAVAHKATKDAVKAADAATKALEAEAGFTQRLLIDNGLVSALTKHGVTNPVHLKAAQAMLREGVTIVVDGDSRVAKFGDKLLDPYVGEWTAGDEGKHFVMAANNSGGGATGGGARQATADIMKLAPVDRMTAARAMHK